jgi:hypothetical protein
MSMIQHFARAAATGAITLLIATSASAARFGSRAACRAGSKYLAGSAAWE